MKNKKLITFLIIGAIILIGGGIFILSSEKKPVPVAAEQIPVEDQVSIAKPEEIGLSLTASSDNKKVFLEIANTKDISSLDYELSYTSKGNIDRGVFGHIEIKQAGQTARQEIILGTCSDICHYDQDVSNIKLILKVAKNDGTTSQVEKILEI